jgi:hypothetical protein
MIEPSNNAKLERNLLSKVHLVDSLALLLSAALLIYMVYLKPGLDNIVDLMNYHAFNGWAIISGEWWNHFHPSFVHHYYINYYDLFHWVVLDSFNVEIAVSIMSAIHLSAAIPIYLLSRELMPNAPKIRSLWIATLSLSTQYFLPHMGDFNGDVLSAIPMLYAIWLLTKVSKSPSIKLASLAGTLAGFSLVLKLTNALYLPFFLLFIALWRLRKQWKSILGLTSGTVFGFLILVLPQSLIILGESKTNPLFPFYNNIFRSPIAPEIAFDAPHYRMSVTETYNWTINILTSPTGDFRLQVFIPLTLLFLLAASVLLVRNPLSNTIRGVRQELVLIAILMASTLGSFWVHALQFGVQRYSVGIWLLTTPLLIAATHYLFELLVEQDKLRNLLQSTVILSFIIALLINLNPVMNRAYEIVPGEKLFEPSLNREIVKYDAIILPGPGVGAWLAVLHREHIKETGQLWLSTAFNREDAKRADAMLKDKDLENVAYINVGGSSAFAEKNLNTLGFTDAGNCRKLEGYNKYGYPYSHMSICDAKYTGEYGYKLENLEDKMYGGGEAKAPIVADLSELKEIFVPFR